MIFINLYIDFNYIYIYTNKMAATVTPNVLTHYDVNIATKRYSCGDSHTVLVSEDGRVWSFGNNNRGQLGLGDTNHRNTPQEITVPASVRIVGVDCGENHTVLVGEDGRVWSFGKNEYGQLGLGNQGIGTGRNTPTEITMPEGVRIVGVGCGYSHTVLIGEDGRVWSFGNNDSGQLGLGDNHDRNTPQEITVLGELVRMVGLI